MRVPCSARSTQFSIEREKLFEKAIRSLWSSRASGARCNPSAGAWSQVAAIDGGHDFEFQNFNLSFDRFGPINYLATDFRYRFRLKAKNDGPLVAPPVDDGDTWYVDNPSLDRTSASGNSK